MNYRTTFIAAVLGLTLFAGAAAQQQNKPRSGYGPRGYDDRVAVRGRTTIRTARGAKTLDVAVSKIAVPGGSAVTIALPDKGFAIFQHRAGDVEMTVGDTRRTLQEGEWVTIPLPARVVLATEDDTALVDAIIVGE